MTKNETFDREEWIKELTNKIKIAKEKFSTLAAIATLATLADAKVAVDAKVSVDAAIATFDASIDAVRVFDRK